MIPVAGDKYRKLLKEETNDPNIVWRHGGPPVFDVVNKLFEQTRTKVWEEGSLEEVVQNAVKTWEMELSHKTRLLDFRTIDPRKFQLIVNGTILSPCDSSYWDATVLDMVSECLCFESR
ncbi:Pathogen-related protein [Linum perenne]